MKIIIFQQHPLEILPPLITLIRIVKFLGIDVTYIGVTETPASISTLKELQIPYRVYPWRIVRFKEHPFLRIWQRIVQPYWYIVFRHWVWRQIDALVKDGNGETVIWSQSMISAAILGDRAQRFGRQHVVTLYDLGDEAGRRYVGFDINALYQYATLVECEYNRAHILMAEKGLSRLPFVLPNKPFPSITQRNLEIHDPVASKIIAGWGNRKVFLYQGALQTDRGELFSVIEWLCCNFPDVVVAVMGRENEAVALLRKRYSNFSYVPFIAPPHHLEVTSHAHIGLAIYKGGAIYGLSPLNAVYCAPNKIYEYAGFGMPLLCNDIPGLRYSVGVMDAGICLNEISEQTVVQAAEKLMSNYERYSVNAKSFFEATDIVNEVKKILVHTRSE